MKSAANTARRGFTLQQQLILLAILITLPFLVHALWVAWHESKRDRDNQIDSALAVTRLVAAEVSQAMIHTRQLLALFAAAIDHQKPLHSLCEPMLRDMVRQQPIYYQAVVAGPDGSIVCGVNPVPAGSTIADREYFQRAIATRTFATSGLVYSRTTGKRTIAAGYPIIAPQGRVRGVLAVSLDLDWLQQRFAGIQLPGDTMISLIDGTGTIVARHPQLPGVIGHPVPDVATFLAIAESRREGIVDTTGRDAVERVTAFARIDGDPSNPAYIRIGVSRASIENHARQILASGLATFTLVLLMAGALAWFAARSLVIAPVRKLIDATQHMGIGDLRLRTGLADDRSEIGRLAGAFDDMAARLQRSVRALRALGAGNRTLIRRQTEQELLDAMCAVAVEKGGYPLAMVHYALADNDKSLVLQAHAGTDGHYAPGLRLTWADTERGRGPVGTAVRTGRRDIIRDLSAEPRFAPWRDMANSRGFRSILSLPLTVEGGVIGAFTLATAETDAFDADEVGLLDEMAADLAFGIETIRARAQRDAAHAAAEHAARHDPVTGLPNRATLVRRIAHLARLAETTGEPSTVLVAYMPRMQDLFDGLGYDASNRILSILAARLHAFNDFGGFVGRITFDEFGMVLFRHNLDEAAAVVLQLRRLFEQPVDLDGGLIEVQASIGITLLPDHGDEPDLLVRRAGLAAREAARRDLPSFVYAGAAERENPLQLAMVAELRRAIEQHELTLYYQPKIDLRSGRMHSVEALVRWMHPDQGMIPPAQFIPLAERTGLIRPMTFAIIEIAARQQAAWMARGLQTPIAINLTARSLVDTQFVPWFAEVLEHHCVPAGLIGIEITESSLVDDPEGARQMLSRLRDLGCRIYIDDFGTGYSCLSYLVNLPVHALKIDRSFVNGMSGNRGAYQVVASVISMAQGLGLYVVAEGVETAQDADILRELGCDMGQGYLFSKPLPAVQLEALWVSGQLARAADSPAG